MTSVEEFYNQVGENIKKIRKERGFTQNDLAHAVELSRTSVTNIETGRQRYPLHKLWEISRFLRIDMIKLLPQSTNFPEMKIKKPIEMDEKDIYEMISALSNDEIGSGKENE
ncbi:helix-turn-helix transcriptional regulator [Bacillaceae bacterium S4-13-58]